MDFIRNHWLGLGIGSIGILVNIFHYLYDYSKNGHETIAHFQSIDSILILTWVPGFLLAGYLYDKMIFSNRRLAASEEKYRFLVEDALDGIDIVDRDGNFVLVNLAYCMMLGYKRDELIGKSFLITLPSEDRGAGAKFFEKAINEEIKPCAYENKNVRKDGSIIDVQTKWNYVYRDGKINGTMAIVRDISERKKAEDELKLRVAELEKFHKVTVGRELKMVELKKEIERLRRGRR